MHRTIQSARGIIIATAVAALIVVGVFTGEPGFIRGQATTTELLGFAWSSNAGWISFTSKNCDPDGDGFSNTTRVGCPSASTAVPRYGVVIDETTGAISGHAWSPNVGWLSFNRADTGDPPYDDSRKLRPGSPLTEIYDCNRDPDRRCTSRSDLALHNSVRGWARFCGVFVVGCDPASGLKPDRDRGGYDGWVHFSGDIIGSWSEKEPMPTRPLPLPQDCGAGGCVIYSDPHRYLDERRAMGTAVLDDFAGPTLYAIGGIGYGGGYTNRVAGYSPGFFGWQYAYGVPKLPEPLAYFPAIGYDVESRLIAFGGLKGSPFAPVYSNAVYSYQTRNTGTCGQIDEWGYSLPGTCSPGYGSCTENRYDDPNFGTRYYYFCNAIPDWGTLSPMPTCRAGAVAELVRVGSLNKVFVIGGVTGASGCSDTNQIPLNKNEVFNIAGGTWTTTTEGSVTLAPMPTPRQGAASVVVNGKIHIFGGHTVGLGSGSNVLATHEVYDPVANNWAGAYAPMPRRRTGHIAALGPNGKIYLFGGHDVVGVFPTTFRVVKTIDVYDPVTNSWSDTDYPPMPTPRTLAGGDILVIPNWYGGSASTNAYIFGGVVDGSSAPATNITEALTLPNPAAFRTVRSGNSIAGQAWGGNVIGWIRMCSYASPTYCVGTDTTAVDPPPGTEFSVALYATPSVGRKPLFSTLTAAVSNPPATDLSANPITYRFDCTDDGTFDHEATVPELVYSPTDAFGDPVQCEYDTVGGYVARVEAVQAPLGIPESAVATVTVVVAPPGPVEVPP